MRYISREAAPTIGYALEASATANVIGRSSDNEWLRVDFGGTSGWVASFVVSLTGSLEDIEVVGVSPKTAIEELRY